MNEDQAPFQPTGGQRVFVESINKTCLPFIIKPFCRKVAGVVLPMPPFWLVIQIAFAVKNPGWRATTYAW
jgi:hypothetical protein